ncbi:protoporphyrinogen/coproporphyrinogen oxidase [Anaerorudis cellulosivorans]|uniref:protoporphyrinogen/coproporphyrinogen oxidase n=1 Tax=Anaerorudis cellulosivorans TaxID=3397862 RepID=UPI00221E92EC|nr:NAD(P)-binding protein [Seramator thermalis]MCW1735277.1 FAD-dependent oxidoreductase [Seramator thermalis]
MIAILGGGIAGISAAYHLNLRSISNILYEQNNEWGGLCNNFTIRNGFLFDYFVHLSFTQNEYVKELFSQLTPYIKHYPESVNYYKGLWLKHPAQNNLAPLSSDEKVKIILDFLKRPDIHNPINYEEWLLAQFGEYFARNFPIKYTLKYWTTEANHLTTNWVENRFSLPPIEDLLKGAFEEQKENFYYAKEMRYPEKGGYKSFLNYMAKDVNIQLNKKATLIDLKSKKIEFSDGSSSYYEKLISSIPLPELINIIKDVPEKIKVAASKLHATSGQLVSLGFNRPDVSPKIWFYIYDEEIEPARAFSPSIKSPNNVHQNKSSLQFETYYSKLRPKRMSGDNLIEHIIQKGEIMKLWSKNDIEVSDYREVEYANVIFDFERSKNLAIVNSFLKEKEIYTCGRFGEWEYFWSDQSLMSGKEVADKLSNKYE